MHRYNITAMAPLPMMADDYEGTPHNCFHLPDTAHSAQEVCLRKPIARPSLHRLSPERCVSHNDPEGITNNEAQTTSSRITSRARM